MLLVVYELAFARHLFSPLESVAVAHERRVVPHTGIKFTVEDIHAAAFFQRHHLLRNDRTPCVRRIQHQNIITIRNGDSATVIATGAKVKDFLSADSAALAAIGHQDFKRFHDMLNAAVVLKHGHVVPIQDKCANHSFVVDGILHPNFFPGIDRWQRGDLFVLLPQRPMKQRVGPAPGGRCEQSRWQVCACQFVRRWVRLPRLDLRAQGAQGLGHRAVWDGGLKCDRGLRLLAMSAVSNDVCSYDCENVDDIRIQVGCDVSRVCSKVSDVELRPLLAKSATVVIALHEQAVPNDDTTRGAVRWVSIEALVVRVAIERRRVPVHLDGSLGHCAKNGRRWGIGHSPRHRAWCQRTLAKRIDQTAVEALVDAGPDRTRITRARLIVLNADDAGVVIGRYHRCRIVPSSLQLDRTMVHRVGTLRPCWMHWCAVSTFHLGALVHLRCGFLIDWRRLRDGQPASPIPC